jgi:hypothetical protein
MNQEIIDVFQFISLFYQFSETSHQDLSSTTGYTNHCNLIMIPFISIHNIGSALHGPHQVPKKLLKVYGCVKI